MNEGRQLGQGLMKRDFIYILNVMKSLSRVGICSLCCVCFSSQCTVNYISCAYS